MYLENDFYLDLAMGRIPGMDFINKHGKAAGLDIGDNFVDIWDGVNLAAAPNTYSYSTSADISSLSSDNTADKMAVSVEGLDANWDMVIQDITIDGTTTVTLDKSLIRVNRIENSSDSALVGNVFCYVDGSTVTAGVPTPKMNIRAIAQAGFDQTQQAIYSVPRNHYALVTNAWANIAVKTSVAHIIHFQVRKFGSVFLTKMPGGVNSTGSGHFQHWFRPFAKYLGKSDIKLEADSSANSSAIAAGFDVILVAGKGT